MRAPRRYAVAAITPYPHRWAAVLTGRPEAPVTRWITVADDNEHNCMVPDHGILFRCPPCRRVWLRSLAWPAWVLRLLNRHRRG